MKPSKAMLILIVGWIFVSVIWFYYGDQYNRHLTIAEQGQFGDKFGGLNTLFTGLALVGVIATIVMQHDEIKGARRDNEQFLQVLAGVADASRAQNASIQHTNYLNALVSRIEGYSIQQELYRSGGTGPRPKNLVVEQDTLFWELAKALESARKAAGTEGNIHKHS